VSVFATILGKRTTTIEMVYPSWTMQQDFLYNSGQGHLKPGWGLDGVVRQHLHFPVGRNVVEKVNVPIPAQTRFLTLVSACSGRADYSWILFGDPFLEPAATVQEEANH
jgi:hypothetical protein